MAKGPDALLGQVLLILTDESDFLAVVMLQGSWQRVADGAGFL
ncbi:hypothetical protein AusDCA_1834 [Desulfitobacterium sp. AusDCA]